MANARFLPQFIRLDGKAIAYVTGTSTDINSNDTRIMVLEGVGGHSDGITTLDFTIKRITPIVDTDTSTLTDIILNKLDAEIAGTLGPDTIVATCRCISFSGNSEAESGKFEGEYKFENSGPINRI